jgi:hypothetical protein
MLAKIEKLDDGSGERELVIRIPFPAEDDTDTRTKLGDELTQYLNFTRRGRRSAPLIEQLNSRGQGRSLYAMFEAEDGEPVELELQASINVFAFNPAHERAQQKLKADQARAKAEQTVGAGALRREMEEKAARLQAEMSELARQMAR